MHAEPAPIYFVECLFVDRIGLCVVGKRLFFVCEWYVQADVVLCFVYPVSDFSAGQLCVF